jgi:hypothetical protein
MDSTPGVRGDRLVRKVYQCITSPTGLRASVKVRITSAVERNASAPAKEERNSGGAIPGRKATVCLLMQMLPAGQTAVSISEWKLISINAPSAR